MATKKTTTPSVPAKAAPTHPKGKAATGAPVPGRPVPPVPAKGAKRGK